MTELGRLPQAEMQKAVKMDTPSKEVAAVLTKLDEVIDALKALTAKMDAETVGSADYAATITDAIEKIKLTL